MMPWSAGTSPIGRRIRVHPGATRRSSYDVLAPRVLPTIDLRVTDMRSGDFQIRESVDGSRVRLTLFGELDMSYGQQLEDRLIELQSEGRSVVMDLSQLEFMDSTGLAIMTRAINSATNEGWEFVIDPGLSPQVRRLFRLTAMDQYAGIDSADSSSASR